jgi:hypothetical protein
MYNVYRARAPRLSIVPLIEQPLVTLVSDNNVIESGDCLLSTSATLCCKICCRTFGFSSSFEIFAIMVSANSFCCLFLTCPSYLTHESRTVFASAARAVFCSSSKASASSFAVSYSVSVMKLCFTEVIFLPLKLQTAAL